MCGRLTLKTRDDWALVRIKANRLHSGRVDDFKERWRQGRAFEGAVRTACREEGGACAVCAF